MERWKVEACHAGQRLDRLLARRFQVARNQVQIWIRDSHVEVDGLVRSASYRVAEGQEVGCAPQAKETATNLEPEEVEVPLLYLDDDLIVVNKPAGVAVHPGAGRPTGTLVNRLLAVYPELASVGGRDRPGIVHRLDIDTTGVLVVARTESAYQALSRAFAERRVGKKYLGIVFGHPKPPHGLIDRPLGRHPKHRKEMTVRSDGREARTGYRTLVSGEGAAALELDLQTGRTHQIRVHLKAIGHPLVGDATYAGNRWRGAPKSLQKALSTFPRPALHAGEVRLEHPREGGELVFTAPVPPDLIDLWAQVSALELGQAAPPEPDPG